MKITILTDNIAGGHFQAEHGLSYLIQIDNEMILFDTGHSDLFLKNSDALGLKIREEVKTVVLSHGHWDHGDGLKYLSGKKLLTHPAAFSKRFRKRDDSYVGLKYSKAELAANHEIQTSEKPVRLTKPGRNPTIK